MPASPPRPPRRPACLAAGAALLLGACTPPAGVHGAAPVPLAPGAALPHASGAADAVRVLDPYLGDRLAALEVWSPRLREAMDRLRHGGVEVVVATTAQGAHVLRGTRGGRLRAPAHTIGTTTTFFDRRSGVVSAVLVRVDVPAATRLAHRRGLGDAGRDRLVEEVLVHELWGHTVPVALAGHMSGACADPRPHEPEVLACVVRRENELRRELGWATRDRYSLALPLARDA